MVLQTEISTCFSFLYHVDICTFRYNPVFLLFPQLFHKACVDVISFKVCKVREKVKGEKQKLKWLSSGDSDSDSDTIADKTGVFLLS